MAEKKTYNIVYKRDTPEDVIKEHIEQITQQGGTVHRNTLYKGIIVTLETNQFTTFSTTAKINVHFDSVEEDGQVKTQ